MQVRLIRPLRDPSGETDEELPVGTVLKVQDMTVETINGAISFSLEADEVEVVPPSFEDLGFTVWELDEGAMAYGLELLDGRYILATDDSGGRLPEDNGPVLIGIYHDAGEPPEVSAYPCGCAAVQSIAELVRSVQIHA